MLHQVNDLSYNVLLETYTYYSIPLDLKDILHPRLEYFQFHNIEIFQNPETLECKVIAYYEHNRKRILYTYYSDRTLTKLHRKNNPAFIEVLNDGNISHIEFFENDIKHNSNGPQEVLYSYTDSPLKIIYRINGKCHREDGPAISYFRNSLDLKKLIKDEEIYMIDGYYRENGPSVIKYDWIGNKQEETWYKQGRIHNLNGPALITYKNDKIISKKWYVNGKPLNRTKMPAFENNVLCGRIKLNQRSILEATIFDREYGTFLKEMYEKIQNEKALNSKK